MGKAALEGLPGVASVTRGFSGSKEINTVIYDAEKIHIDEMVRALKDAGTYLGTAPE